MNNYDASIWTPFFEGTIFSYLNNVSVISDILMTWAIISKIVFVLYQAHTQPRVMTSSHSYSKTNPTFN